jgi:nucleoid-associated protein YgaU
VSVLTALPRVPADGDGLALFIAVTLAIAVATWHVLGVVICIAARAWPHRHALARLTLWCPPVARRAAGIAWSASVVFAPLSAHAATPVDDTPAADEPFVRAPATTSTTVAPQPSSPPLTPAPTSSPAPVPPPAPAPAADRVHVVVRGDNLWRIASTELTRVTGDARPSDSAIVPYWRKVIDANRATLRSGDPSLIYPGEAVTLPPL